MTRYSSQTNAVAEIMSALAWAVIMRQSWQGELPCKPMQTLQQNLPGNVAIASSGVCAYLELLICYRSDGACITSHREQIDESLQVH